MGGTTFYTEAEGTSPQNAFEAAVAEAEHDHGRSGYTGTIAEKSAFIVYPLLPGLDAEDYAEMLMRRDDNPHDGYDDPAGCIDIGGGKYYFFGVARE